MRILVFSVETAQAKNNSDYLRIRFCDESKVVRTAVMFSPFPDPKTISGKVCEANIRQGQPTDKIESLTLVPDADPSPFIKKTSVNADKAREEMRAATRGAGISEELTKIVDAVLLANDSRWAKFSTWPAAAHNHHAYQGGLMEHTLSMLREAVAIVKGGDLSNQGLNVGVVNCSIVLHDIGKIATYSSTATETDYTVFQHLLGHIVISDEMITAACSKLGISSAKGDAILMRHCVLSHHGKREWGSPITPCTREAIFVHQLDMIQSRTQMALEGTEPLERGKVSTQHKALDTYLYKP